MTRLGFALPVVAVAASLLAPLQVRAGTLEARDPFRPFFLGAPVLLASAPLGRFSLEDLHVEGIVSGITDPRALVRAPDGQTYEVGIGGIMGNRNGRVAQITKDAVVVIETQDDAHRELILGLGPQNE